MFDLGIEECCSNHMISKLSGQVFIYNNNGKVIILKNYFEEEIEKTKLTYTLPDQRTDPQVYIYEQDS